MLVLGLILILVAAAAGVTVVVNAPAVTTPVTIFDRTYEFTSTQMFFAGAIGAVVLLIGFAMVVRGGRRSAVRRQRLRRSRLEASDLVTQLESEKRDLERKLESTPASSVSKPRPHATGDDTAATPSTTTPDDRLVAGGRHTRAADEPAQRG